MAETAPKNSSDPDHALSEGIWFDSPVSGSEEISSDLSVSDSSASLSSSDESSESESEAEESSPTAAGIPRSTRLDPPSALRSRLQSFLPQLKDANERLDRFQNDLKFELAHENLDEQDEGYSTDDADAQRGGPYIELDLGLGVLEETQEPNMNLESVTASAPAVSESEPRKRTFDKASDEGNEENVLGALMGDASAASNKRRRTIQILDSEQDNESHP